MINTTLLVLPIFIVVFLGFILRRYDIITEEYIKVSNRLVFIIFLPALLFVEISKTSFLNDPYGKLFAVMFFSVCIIFLLSIIIGRIIKMDKKTIGTFAMNNFRANYAYMGLPVVFYAYGQTGLSIGSILMAFIVPFVNLLSVVSLTMGGGSEGRKPLYLLKSTLINPIAMACIIGLLFSIFKIQLPLFLLRSLDIVSKVALPIALIGIGATINFRYISGNKLYLFVNAFMKLLLLPLIAYFMLKSIDNNLNIAGKTLIVMLSAPPATVNFVLATMMDGDAELASSGIMLSTVLSILTFIFWLSLLGI